MSIVGFLPFVLLIAVFYFLLIRPQQKRAQQHKSLLKEIEPGDEIVTIGGVFGDVVEMDDTRVLLELYDGSQVEFLRSAISRRVVPESQEAHEDAADDELDVTGISEKSDLTEGADDDVISESNDNAKKAGAVTKDKGAKAKKE